MEKLNDLERQHLKQNARIIREVNYERDAKSAVQAVLRFKETFHRCYEQGPGSDEIFHRLESYLAVLADLKPIAKKPAPSHKNRSAND